MVAEIYLGTYFGHFSIHLGESHYLLLIHWAISLPTLILKVQSLSGCLISRGPHPTAELQQLWDVAVVDHNTSMQSSAPLTGTSCRLTVEITGR